MKKSNVFAALSLITMFSTGAYALDLNNPLPNWVDKNREKADGKPPAISATRAVPPSGFHLPAEYEPAGAVVISWAAYTDMLTGIAKAVTGPGKAQLWAVAGPSSISGVPASKYSRISAPIDSVWVRDYGPFGIEGNKPGIVDTIYRHYQYRRNDDAVPAVLAKAKNIGVYQMPLILDGGNLMVDSKGNLFTTKRTYIWNSDKSQEQVDSLLKSYFGAKKVITFEYSGYPGEPADGTGHIDMFMKLLDDNTVLLSVADTEPFKSNTEKAMAWFKANKAPNGQPYKIITVKGWATDAWYTYTNSLVVNGVAIIPSYSNKPQEEAAAKAAYESAGYTVVPVNSDESIVSGGSIHCTTQVIPMLPSGRALNSEEVFTQLPEYKVDMTAAPLGPLTGSETSTALNQLLGK